MIQVAVQPTSETKPAARRTEMIHRFFGAIQARDGEVLNEILTPDAVTTWPQSGERIIGATSCVRVYENYPGGPPKYRLERVSGSGDTWVAELVGDYGEERWHAVSIIKFKGPQISRVTDYFGPSFPAPEWRQQWVEYEEAID
jgi:hypothetical protein